MKPMASYQDSVFINCPFDSTYRSLFHAAVFTIHDAGFTARCSLEIIDAGEIRLSKIFRLIEQCKYGLHDISRTEVNDAGLPRFNMPLELGIFLACQRYGSGRNRSKNCLILDRDRYRYQQFISDIAGQDISAHGDNPDDLIIKVRDWLRSSSPKQIPGGQRLVARFAKFQKDLPKIYAELHLDPANVIFADYSKVLTDWLIANPLK